MGLSLYQKYNHDLHYAITKFTLFMQLHILRFILVLTASFINIFKIKLQEIMKTHTIRIYHVLTCTLYMYTGSICDKQEHVLLN